MTTEETFWLHVIRRYFAFVAAGNFLWEFAHMPLYTIWWEADAGQITFAAIHCTAGDLLIAGASVLGALMLLGTGQWPRQNYIAVAALTIVTGVIYTIFSEWYNTEKMENWAYSELMPTLPIIGTGLSPLAQWVVIPLLAFWWAGRGGNFTNRTIQAATDIAAIQSQHVAVHLSRRNERSPSK